LTAVKTARVAFISDAQATEFFAFRLFFISNGGKGKNKRSKKKYLDLPDLDQNNGKIA